jgi:hypothetical protein
VEIVGLSLTVHPSALGSCDNSTLKSSGCNPDAFLEISIFGKRHRPSFYTYNLKAIRAAVDGAFHPAISSTMDFCGGCLKLLKIRF